MVSKNSLARVPCSNFPFLSLIDTRFPKKSVRFCMSLSHETNRGVLHHSQICWHTFAKGFICFPHLLALLSPVSLTSLLFFPIHVFPMPFPVTEGLLCLAHPGTSSAPCCLFSKSLPSSRSLPEIALPHANLAFSPDAHSPGGEATPVQSRGGQSLPWEAGEAVPNAP